MADQRQARALAALTNADTHQPFPIRDIDANNGSELINQQLLLNPRNNNLMFARSRSGNKNDSAHGEQKNWITVRQLAGSLRHDTEAEQDLLAQNWTLST